MPGPLTALAERMGAFGHAPALITHDERWRHILAECSQCHVPGEAWYDASGRIVKLQGGTTVARCPYAQHGHG